jgi:hypothetical protein
MDAISDKAITCNKCYVNITTLNTPKWNTNYKHKIPTSCNTCYQIGFNYRNKRKLNSITNNSMCKLCKVLINDTNKMIIYNNNISKSCDKCYIKQYGWRKKYKTTFSHKLDNSDISSNESDCDDSDYGSETESDTENIIQPHGSSPQVNPQLLSEPVQAPSLPSEPVQAPSQVTPPLNHPLLSEPVQAPSQVAPPLNHPLLSEPVQAPSQVAPPLSSGPPPQLNHPLSSGPQSTNIQQINDNFINSYFSSNIVINLMKIPVNDTYITVYNGNSSLLNSFINLNIPKNKILLLEQNSEELTNRTKEEYSMSNGILKTHINYNKEYKYVGLYFNLNESINRPFSDNLLTLRQYINTRKLAKYCTIAIISTDIEYSSSTINTLKELIKLNSFIINSEICYPKHRHSNNKSIYIMNIKHQS